MSVLALPSFVWVSVALLELQTDVSSWERQAPHSSQADSFYTSSTSIEVLPFESSEKSLGAGLALDRGAGLHRPALPGLGVPGSSSPHPHHLNWMLESPCKITPPAPSCFPWSSPFTDSAMRRPGRDRIMFCLRGAAGGSITHARSHHSTCSSHRWRWD